MQEDSLFEFMTVEEAITLAANLKLDKPQNEIQNEVNTTISDLGLE